MVARFQPGPGDGACAIEIATKTAVTASIPVAPDGKKHQSNQQVARAGGRRFSLAVD
jgi:hypothetical protein